MAKLHFSIEGEFVTNAARDKLIQDHDLNGAIRLLDSALVTTDLNELEKTGLMFKILTGEMAVVGTYPGEDYGVDETPENKNLLALAISEQGKKIKDLEETNETLLGQLETMAPLIPVSIKKDINENCGETVFDVDNTIEDIERDISGILNETDYGWLSPSGNFTPVQFGQHEAFALEYVKKHTTPEERMELIRKYHSRMTDWLIYTMHFVLLHNPSMGPAQITRDEFTTLTDAQQKFLYEYLERHGRHEDAKVFLNEYE